MQSWGKESSFKTGLVWIYVWLLTKSWMRFMGSVIYSYISQNDCIPDAILPRVENACLALTNNRYVWYRCDIWFPMKCRVYTGAFISVSRYGHGPLRTEGMQMSCSCFVCIFPFGIFLTLLFMVLQTLQFRHILNKALVLNMSSNCQTGLFRIKHTSVYSIYN